MRINSDESTVRSSAKTVVYDGGESMVPSQSLKSIVARMVWVSFDSGNTTARKSVAPVLAPILVYHFEHRRG